MCPQGPVIKQVRELTAQGKKDGSTKAIRDVGLDEWDETPIILGRVGNLPSPCPLITDDRPHQFYVSCQELHVPFCSTDQGNAARSESHLAMLALYILNCPKQSAAKRPF